MTTHTMPSPWAAHQIDVSAFLPDARAVCARAYRLLGFSPKRLHGVLGVSLDTVYAWLSGERATALERLSREIVAVRRQGGDARPIVRHVVRVYREPMEVAR